jgi:hypothetical protein
VDDDVLVIGPDSGLMPNGPSSLGRSHPGSGRRVALAVFLLLSLFMLVVSFVEHNATNVFIFGAAAMVLFAFLGFSAARR